VLIWGLTATTSTVFSTSSSSLTASVAAHDAAIIKSAPANGDVLDESPSEVIAWFAEELVSGESTITVFDTQGNQVDNGDGGVDLNDPDHASMMVTLPSMPDGSYTVQWHAVLLDGDATDGAFAFAVGIGQPVSQPAVPVKSQNGWSPGLIIAAAGFILVLLLISVLLLRIRQS
jgi:methionine-rich copper-binding protein CopC